MRVRYRSRAREDIRGIFNYRSLQHGLGVAVRVEIAIRSSAKILGEYPEFGRETNHRGVRRWPVKKYKYTIFYVINWLEGAIEIVRVVASGRVRNLKQVPK